MPSEEGRECLGQTAWILHLEQVSRLGELEGLDVRQPREQEVASLAEDGVAVLAEDGERGLGDASRFLAPERPLHHRGQFLAEERVRVRHGLVEGTGERLLEHGAVVGPADAAHPRVDGARLVAHRVALERRLDDRSDHLAVQCGRRRRPRRLQQRERMHGVGSVERELERHARARGVADHVRAHYPEVAHERQAVRGLPGEADRTGQTTAPGIAGAVVTDQAVAVAESRLLEQRSEEIRTTPACISTTGSPVPRTSYSSSIPSIGARSIADDATPRSAFAIGRTAPSCALSPSVGQVVLHREQGGADAG